MTRPMPAASSSMRSTQEVRDWPGFFGQHQSISPDGTRLVRQEEVAPPVVTADGVVQTVGPLMIRDLTDGDVVVELEGVCTYEFRGSVTRGDRSPMREVSRHAFRHVRTAKPRGHPTRST